MSTYEPSSSESDVDRNLTETAGSARPRSVLTRVLAILALVVVIDVALCYVLEPYGGYTEVVWSEYYGRPDSSIETVLVGSSFAQFDLDPTAIENGLDSPTFSLATPAQSMSNSYSAVERAIADHQPERVILGIAYDTLCNKPWINSAITFTQNKIQGESLPDAAQDVARLFSDPYFRTNSFSIVALFPWSISHVAFNPGAIAANVKNRATQPTALDASRVMFPDLPFDDKGRAADDGLLDFDTVNSVGTMGLPAQFEQHVVDALEQICILCEEHGVALYVVATPRPEFATLGVGDRYAQNMKAVQEMVLAHGAHLLDYNLSRPSYYRAAETEFKDTDHLNLAGAERFCSVLTDAINSIETGESVEDRFFSYGEWDAYLDSLTSVSAVTFDSTAAGDCLELKATAYTDPNKEVEFEFSVADPSSGEERVVRQYGTDPCCSIRLEGHGSHIIVVRARIAGSDAPYERRCEREVLY